MNTNFRKIFLLFFWWWRVFNYLFFFSVLEYQNLMRWKQTWKMNLKESPPTSNLIKNLILTRSLTCLQLLQDKQQCHMAEPTPKYSILNLFYFINMRIHFPFVVMLWQFITILKNEVLEWKKILAQVSFRQYGVKLKTGDCVFIEIFLVEVCLSVTDFLLRRD